MKQYKQYVISLKNLSVVMTANKQNWDILVILNSTKEMWLKVNGVKLKDVDLVMDTIKMGDKELSKVYLEMSN
jgi:regulation of enolase protein 1 (concanavalin A-like superfamily)